MNTESIAQSIARAPYAFPGGMYFHDWLKTDQGRLWRMIVDCEEQKPTPGPRACPFVRQWCAMVTAWEVDFRRIWARETGQAYKPAPVRLDSLTLLPL